MVIFSVVNIRTSRSGNVVAFVYLDYLFELSDPIPSQQQQQQQQQQQKYPPSLYLQPNVVLAWFTEPAHGGFFMLQPTPGAFFQLSKIIELREQAALQLPYPHFDPLVGWGHKIDLHDVWYGIPEARTKYTTIQHPNGTVSITASPNQRHSGTNWSFHGDFADQGLLYYWTKYYLKQVSILQLDYMEHWTTHGPNGTLSKQVLSGNPLRSVSCLPLGMEYPNLYGSAKKSVFWNHTPHRDFVHFTGDTKPWSSKTYRKYDNTLLPNGTTITTTRVMTHRYNCTSSTDYWYFQLAQLNAIYHLNLSVEYVPKQNHHPILGRYPTHRSMIGTIQAKVKRRQREQQQQLLLQSNNSNSKNSK